MNYIKTTIAKAEYKKVQPIFGKYIIRVLAVEKDDMVSSVECMVDHEPTEAEIKSIEADAEAYYLPSSKSAKVAEITAYDKSDAVNSFTLGGNAMWLPLEERKSMRQSLIALKAESIETFTYWLGLTPITMSVAQFEAIMDKVEVYALQCFNVTAQHKAEVMSLTTIAEVEAYDITVGYPPELEF